MASDRPVREAENRLERFNADRERLLAEVERRVVGRRIDEARAGGDASLEYVLNDVAFCEIRRLESSGGSTDCWRDLSRRLLEMTEEDKQSELRALVRYYGHDVVGNFDPRVYKFATGLGPSILGFVFSPIASLRDGVHAIRHLDARITADGELDVVRACAERGTIIVTPTHSSNMDSPVIGLGLTRAGLPPVTYGAGKNLFTNPFISFFMRNLGAYRVDWRLRFELYKDVLKEYSTVLLEHGYHSLFFPGGTRNRSNMVDKHLKLGLLGTTVTAYKNSVREGAPQKRLYVVPWHDQLPARARGRDADRRLPRGDRQEPLHHHRRRVLARRPDGRVLPQDPGPRGLGGRALRAPTRRLRQRRHRRRRVDRSRRPRGRSGAFVRGADGEVADDDQRDAEYTRALGRRLAAVYPKLTVFHATHLVARALYDAIAKVAGTRDIYRLMRAPSGQLAVPMPTAIEALVSLRARLAQHVAWGAEHPLLQPQAATAIIDDAVRGLSSYHTRPIVQRRGDALVVDDVKLLYYYQNRMSHVPAQGDA